MLYFLHMRIYDRG